MDIEFIMYRILCGFLEYEGSKIFDPAYKTSYKGRKVYDQIKSSCFDTLTDNEAYILLVETEQWDSDREDKLGALPKEIENRKLQLFNSYFNLPMKKEIALGLQYDKNLFYKLNSDRNQYFHMTADGIATAAMWFEMIRYMYKGADTLSALSFYQTNYIVEEVIRDIALSYEWQSYFTVGKNIFGKPTIKMTKNQRRLMNWSNIYKNIRSHTECPPDVIIADHDAFDGWMISENKKEKSKKKIDRTFTGKKIKDDATTVFSFVKTKDEIKEVYDFNDPNGLMKIKSMENQIKAQKNVKDKDFAFRKFMK